MIRHLLRLAVPNTLYVQIRANEFAVKHLESSQTRRKRAATPFTTRRLLVGNFLSAEALLKTCFGEVLTPFARLVRPNVVMHQLEMVEGGLSAVEERVLLELASGAGAHKVRVWVGHPLSDSAVNEKLREI